MSTLDDALDEIVTYLQSNMATVTAGTLSSSSIIYDVGLECSKMNMVRVFLIGDALGYTVGGYCRQTPLIQIKVSAETKDKRNSIRDDVITTLNAGMAAMTHVQTLRFVGCMDGPLEMIDYETAPRAVPIYTAILEMEAEFS